MGNVQGALTLYAHTTRFLGGHEPGQVLIADAIPDGQVISLGVDLPWNKLFAFATFSAIQVPGLFLLLLLVIQTTVSVAVFYTCRSPRRLVFLNANG